jgi:hypothetical protein
MMNTRSIIQFTVSMSLVGLLVGCPASEYELGHLSASDGSLDAGGVTSTGGTPEATGGGGALGTGGVSPIESTPVAIGSGGSLGTGDVIATGGVPVAIGSGGVLGTGGVIPTGGTPVATGVGGILGTGGVASLPGTGGTPSGSGNVGNVVTFNNGQAQGAMTGLGWVALGKLDTITDPTCGSEKLAITESMHCAAATNWSAPDKLCITGLVPAVLSNDFTNNWGVQVGLNSTNPSGGGLGQAFSTITMSFTGMPTTGLRAVMHVKTDPSSTVYCANLMSDVVMAVSNFNTQCWDGSGTSLKAADVPNIDTIAVQISSTYSPVTVQNFCLSSIKFGN